MANMPDTTLSSLASKRFAKASSSLVQHQDHIKDLDEEIQQQAEQVSCHSGQGEREMGQNDHYERDEDAPKEEQVEQPGRTILQDFRVSEKISHEAFPVPGAKLLPSPPPECPAGGHAGDQYYEGKPYEQGIEYTQHKLSHFTFEKTA